MDTPLHKTIEIRPFSNPAEVRGLSNFVENKPIRLTNYKQLLGHYSFDEKMCCCFEKENGNLCREPHKRGWVVELSDGTATIIGNHCAEKQFGADSNLITDRNRYVNEQRHQERLSKILQQIREKSHRLQQLEILRVNLVSLLQRVKTFSGELGEMTVRRLQDMARTGQPTVAITAVKYREYLDDNDGKTKREARRFSQRLGVINGLDLIQWSSFYKLYEDIKDIGQAHEEAERLGDNPKRSAVDSLAARLNEYDRILQEGDRLLNLEHIFFDNNFRLLCFLNPWERQKSASLAMRRSGTEVSKRKVRDWITEQDEMIKKQFNIDAIEIR